MATFTMRGKNVQLADINMLYMERDFSILSQSLAPNCYKRMEIFVLKKGKPARENPWAHG